MVFSRDLCCGVGGAVALLEGVLHHAVEGERRHGAIKAQHGNSPLARRKPPASTGVFAGLGIGVDAEGEAGMKIPLRVGEGAFASVCWPVPSGTAAAQAANRPCSQ